jgi:HEPN domain-containing protein
LTPTEDARLLLKAVLVLNAQEPPRSHSLQTLIQGLEACGETIPLAPELLALDDFAVLARYDAKPTPLPADLVRLLDLLDAPYQNLRKRAG